MKNLLLAGYKLLKPTKAIQIHNSLSNNADVCTKSSNLSEQKDSVFGLSFSHFLKYTKGEE